MWARTMQSWYRTGTCRILLEMSEFRFERVEMLSNRLSDQMTQNLFIISEGSHKYGISQQKKQSKEECFAMWIALAGLSTDLTSLRCLS